MKKTININLGGQPFIIDEPAYDILHQYFEALKAKFTNEAERKEIINDIEYRVAEVFTQRLGRMRSVVSEEDVLHLITIMGRPEDIAGDTDSAAAQSSTTGAAAPGTTSFYQGPRDKKLFRDPDDKKVGGVISGMCHYFGWGDPSWIRIAVMVLFLLGLFGGWGFWLPLTVVYFILLIVVPLASTSAEKLQMRGQPVTIQNIEKEVRDAMTTAGSSIHSTIGSGIARPESLLYTTFSMIAKVILCFVMVIDFSLLMGLMAIILGISILGSESLSEITHLVVTNRSTIWIANIGLFLAAGIPLIAIMYYSIRVLVRSRTSVPWVGWSMFGAWIIGLALLASTTWSVFKDFAATTTTSEKVQLMTPRGGTLLVQLADTMGNVINIKSKKNDEDDEMSFVISGIDKTNYGFAFNDVKLELAVSPDSNFYLEKIRFSRGSNTADANKNIQTIHYKFSQTDSVLNLDDKFEISKDSKYRGQKVKLRLYIPQGKHVKFADNIDEMEVTARGNSFFDDMSLAGTTVQISDGKVTCIDCNEKIVQIEDITGDDDDDMSDLQISKKGISISTTAQDSSLNNLKNIQVKVNQNGVTLTGKNDKEENVKVKVDNQGVRVIRSDSSHFTHITKTK